MSENLQRVCIAAFKWIDILMNVAIIRSSIRSSIVRLVVLVLVLVLVFVLVSSVHVLVSVLA